MANNSTPLAEGEYGRYSELAGRPLPAGLVFQFIPSLVAVLTRAEQLTRRSLTREEVLRIRDNYRVQLTRPTWAVALENGRCYGDLDPSNPWPGWQELRGAAKN